MALRLVRWGARLCPNEVAPGTGWVNVVSPGSSNPYIFPRYDQCLTVTATECDGVRIYDWGKNLNLYTESTSGSRLHSAVAFVSGAGVGPVVRVLNPTESTEVTIMSEPLPPPYFVERLLRWAGGCRGAETRETRHRGVPGARRGAHHRERRVVDSVGSGTHLPTGGHLLGRNHTRGERGETRQRNSEGHLPTGGVVHQGRPPASAIHAGRASNPRHARVAQGVGA